MSRAVKSLLQVALTADDLDASEAIYRRLLGAEPAGRYDPPRLLGLVALVPTRG